MANEEQARFCGVRFFHQQGKKLIPIAGVQGGCRFIRDDQIRTADQGTRSRNTSEIGMERAAAAAAAIGKVGGGFIKRSFFFLA